MLIVIYQGTSPALMRMESMIRHLSTTKDSIHSIENKDHLSTKDKGLGHKCVSSITFLMSSKVNISGLSPPWTQRNC